MIGRTGSIRCAALRRTALLCAFRRVFLARAIEPCSVCVTLDASGRKVVCQSTIKGLRMKDFTVREVEGAGPVGARRLRRAGSPPLPFASQRPKPAPAWAAAWLRLDLKLKLDPVKAVVHAPAAGHLSVDELRKLTVKRRLAQSVLAPELIEPAPRLHGHGDLHLGSKALSVPDLGSGRCAYSEVTLTLRVAPTSSMGYRELTSLKTLAPSMSFLKFGSRRYKEAPQRHPCSRSRGLAGPSTEAHHRPAIFVENSLP